MSDPKRPMLNSALRLARLYWGYSQIELASQLGVSQSMISDIERGTKDVSLDTLEKYSRTLDVPMSKLMLFAEELNINPAQMKGKIFISQSILSFLEKIAPEEKENGTY